MKKILLFYFLAFFVFNTSILKAQTTSFNFSCTRDTLVSCTIPCITLQAQIPDIHGLGSSYSVNPAATSANGCYNPYVPPNAPGSIVIFTEDDKYSPIIPIGFSFPFFGVTYTNLVVNTNGVVTFDLTKANQPNAAYGILNNGGTLSASAGTPQNLPSVLYDKTVIMCPYSDIDPSVISNPIIGYTVTGTAPYRRWVFSFYKIPLFSCNNLNRNTYQAVLYESLGIIEVFISEKDNCASWNQGRAMIGIQDVTVPATPKFKMAPGRAASDGMWGLGSTPMNESWRFTPDAGPSLFKRVELYDLANTFITNGTVSPGSNGILNVDFPNVCPTTSPATYIIRSVYQKIDDPLVEIFGSDTVTVTRDASLPVTAGNVDPVCNTGTGSITVSDPLGAVYEYSIDNVNWQASPVFNNLPAGTYTVRARISGTFCGGNSIVTLTAPPPIPITATVTSATCKTFATGSITVTSPVGVDYEYSINGGTTWQASPVFPNRAAGNYTITINQISISCKSSQLFTVTEPTLLTASALPASQASCANNDGSITVTPNGGTPAYEFSADNGVNWQTSNTLTGLSIGNYAVVKVRDMNGCISNVNAATVSLNDTMRLELGPNSTICFGNNITLIPQTNALTDTFKWTPKATLNFDTVRTPIAKPTDTTKYYLTAKWGVCTRKDSITVNVLHKPVANAGKDTTVCYKTNATLFGSASNLSGTVNFAWSPPDSLSSPNTAVTAVRLDTTRQFTLTVTDNYGCNFSVTDSVIVIMQPKLVAFAGNDTNAIINREHQLMATGKNAVDFVWSPAGPLNNPFIANPIAIINRNTYFYVHITDAIGCTDDDTIFIKAYEGPTYYLPNAFTPNGDSRNDIFFPTPVGIRSTDYFRIFNRFGELMYETRQWMQGWDGTIKGKPAASGAYVWMIKGIDKNGSIVEMKGTMILLR